MTPKLNTRTLIIMLVAALLGAAWATYNYTSTGGDRGEDQLQRLVWTIFATPFFLFIGWLIARRAEKWLAAFVCFCLYFFTPFVAARIESLFLTQEEAQNSAHPIYFPTVIVLHTIVSIGIAIWRARTPIATHDTPTPTSDEPQHATATSE